MTLPADVLALVRTTLQTHRDTMDDQMRVRYLEIDRATDQRWQHRGGHYEVMMTPL